MSAHGEVDMGHTVAGWTGTVMALLGACVAGGGMCLGSAPVLGGGVVVVVLAAFVTWLLHLAGWGKPGGPRPEAEWDWRVRDSMTRHHDCLGCRMAGRRRTAPVLPAAADPEKEPALAEA
ncbi:MULTISPECIES: HGxxPAAW family protein [unclassified Streptomyces]|uniref:HGxxPAAW family protein n=1 Tax=unclassified Streptomyces TaxID=2593676 RepID=UPI0036DFE149